MSGWDLLADDEPPDRPDRPESAYSAATGWGSLDGEATSEPWSDTTSTTDTVAVIRTWPSFDEEPDQAELSRPAPELTAAHLKDGEVYWARVNGQDATLGSETQLYLPAGVPDGIGGWRRVRVTDARTLRAEVLALPVEIPVQGTADEPRLLFPTDPARTQPPRPPGFPVGEGGDLSAAFEARVRDARERWEQAESAAKQAEAGAEEKFRRRGDQLERQLREDYQQRSRAAEQRVQAEAARQFGEVRADADRRVRQLQADAAREIGQVKAEANRRVELAAQDARHNQGLRQQAETERDSTGAALARLTAERSKVRTAAVAGWVVAVLLLLLVLVVH